MRNGTDETPLNLIWLHQHNWLNFHLKAEIRVLGYFEMYNVWKVPMENLLLKNLMKSSKVIFFGLCSDQ